MEVKDTYICNRARRYCSYQERSICEVKRKLNEWKVNPEAAREIICLLEEENYINQERFARAFSGGKFRMKKWGRNRIISELRARKIPDLIIQNALEEIDEFEYEKTLKEIIEQRKQKLKQPERFEEKAKIFNFVYRKGYEKHLIHKYL